MERQRAMIKTDNECNRAKLRSNSQYERSHINKRRLESRL